MRYFLFSIAVSVEWRRRVCGGLRYSSNHPVIDLPLKSLVLQSLQTSSAAYVFFFVFLFLTSTTTVDTTIITYRFASQLCTSGTGSCRKLLSERTRQVQKIINTSSNFDGETPVIVFFHFNTKRIHYNRYC